MSGFSSNFFDAAMLRQAKLFMHNIGLFLLLVTVFSILGMGVMHSIGYIVGINVADLQVLNDESPTSIRNGVRVMTLILQFSYFILPTFAFTYIQYGRKWHTIFKLGSGMKLPLILLSVGLIAASFPFAQFLYKFNASLHLPVAWVQTDMQTTAKIAQLMKMQSPLEFSLNLLVIGIVPALVEEMLFRGLFQQCLAHYTKSHLIAIMLGAIVFSAIHFQFLGFLPRCMMGILLGYIFYYTRNLWYSIVGHAFFNSVQVIHLYFKPEEIAQLNPLNTNIDSRLMVGSLLAMALFFFLLHKKVKAAI